MKFYLSSTFKGLEDEREQVKRAFQDFSRLDYTLTTTEMAHSNPLAQCLEDVKGCDAFILLFGVWYGHPIKDEETGEILSMTHREFRLAKELNKKITVFQLNSYDYCEPSSDEQAKRNAFLEEIKAYGIYPKKFDCGAITADKVSLHSAIQSWIIGEYLVNPLFGIPPAEQSPLPQSVPGKPPPSSP